MINYHLNELPPHHKALVELVKTLKVDTVTDLGDSVVITYSDGKKPLTVRIKDNAVPGNGN